MRLTHLASRRRAEKGTTRQRGQVVPIFAITLGFIVGAIALAVDYGLLTNQHRNLQDYADHAAIAGGQRLGAAPSATERANARKTAWSYLNDNLGAGLWGAGSGVPCQGGSAAFTSDIGQASGGSGTVCRLPSPYDSYQVAIYSPSEDAGTGGNSTTSQLDTISVRITEAVATSFASVSGIGTANAGALAVAQYVGPTQRSPFALYSNGCVTTGIKLEVIAGDAYLNRCTLSNSGGAQAGFCARSTPGSAGNILVGPEASLPLNLLGNQSAVNCAAAVNGFVVGAGDVETLRSELPMPSFVAPPGIPVCSPASCTTAAATAINPCTNGTVTAGGAVPSNCFNAGAYSTVGPVVNNLNPGVYYITGDPACNRSNATYCPGVVFAKPTMNANFADVQDMCWAAPNLPASGSFSSPCPTGFAFNPTTAVDPQCSGSLQAPIAAPLFSLTGAIVGGSLPAGTYYVRVTSVGGLGESASVEHSVVIAAGSAGKITVSITAVPGVSYRIYGPTTVAGKETFNSTVGPGLITVTANLTTAQSPLNPANGTYPLFDTTSCLAGFHNIPTNGTTNYGVTFVLMNKASVCFQTTTSPTLTCGDPLTGTVPATTVLLSPYCSTLPATSCSGNTGNDGAFVVYAPIGLAGTNEPGTTGGLQVSGVGVQLGLTGTVYLPQGRVIVENTAQFEDIKGQLLVNSASLNSGNTLNPLVYFDATNGAFLAPQVPLIR